MFGKIKDRSNELKQEIAALYLACKRKDVPWYAKAFVAVVIAYALSPIDLIPDFIPVLGYLDDLVLIPLGIRIAIKLVPEPIMQECRIEAVGLFKDGKPRSWKAGAVIILIWIVLVWVLASKVFSFELPIDNNTALKYLLLFTGSFLAAAISGAAGFGGALLLLPLLSRTIGTTMAVPVLTFAQLIGNLSRVSIGFRQIHWKPVSVFIAGAIPAAMLGAWSFAVVPKDVVTRIIGIAIIIFVVLKYFKLLEFKPGNITMILGGALVGLLSGLVGSAGPLGAAIFLSLNLPPVAYIASEAVTATAMHIVKTMVYQKYIGIGIREVSIGLFMGAAMILGTWAGKKFIENMPKEKFVKFVGVLLCLVGLQMLVFG
ncbi:MAG: sulfite exporter TauE/SafE family protein [Clostridiales bacterium]|nr:sulfite exporter TauE/SafE family protein [Clostridiales bacterium]